MAIASTPITGPFSSDPPFGSEAPGDSLLLGDEQDSEQVSEIELTELAAHVTNSWEAARHHRDQSVTSRLGKAQRQRQGEYEPGKLSQIQEYGGSELYFNVTDTKCLAAEAWVMDFLARNPDGRTWSIEPTPIPDLPPGDRDEVVNQVTREFQAATDSGEVVSPEAVQTRALEVFDERLRAVHEEARERMERMTKKIMDQMLEGGYSNAFRDFVYYITTYANGVMKGPVIRNKKRLRWSGEVVDVVVESVPTWEAVNPHDFYPGPNSRAIDDSYICERVRFNPADLSMMRGQEGWSSEAINKVLEDRNSSLLSGEIMGPTPTRTRLSKESNIGAQ